MTQSKMMKHWNGKNLHYMLMRIANRKFVPLFISWQSVIYSILVQEGQRLVFREGRTKAVGNVTLVIPHNPVGAGGGGKGGHDKAAAAAERGDKAMAKANRNEQRHSKAKDSPAPAAAAQAVASWRNFVYYKCKEDIQNLLVSKCYTQPFQLILLAFKMSRIVCENSQDIYHSFLYHFLIKLV